jgi:hypothetical protein
VCSSDLSIVAGADTTTGATGISYARNWIVAYNPNGDQAWVTITINWNDPTAKTTHSISLRSVVSQ